MIIKIDAVTGIPEHLICKIVDDYINHCKKNNEPIATAKNTGIKIDSCNRRYHVGCHKTKTMTIFKIWWAM